MLKIVVILCLTLFLSSCYYIWPVYPEEEKHWQGGSEVDDTRQFAQVTSSHLFVYGNHTCIACNALLPAKIYNPNNHVITVTANGIDYVIPPLTFLSLEAQDD